MFLVQLGIPVSNAVNIFLKQVVMQRGIPFDVKLPAIKPEALSDLTEIELNEELEKGYTDFTQGNTKSAEKVFSDIRRDYGIWNTKLHYSYPYYVWRNGHW